MNHRNFLAVVRVGFVGEPYQAAEESGAVTLTVQVMGELGAELQVNLTTEDTGDATGKFRDKREGEFRVFTLDLSSPSPSSCSPSISPFSGPSFSSSFLAPFPSLPPSPLPPLFLLSSSSSLSPFPLLPPLSAGVDYVPLQEVLTFNADILLIQINVTLNDDLISEGDEQFLARLQIISKDTMAELVPDDNAPVIILDNDGKSD